MSNAMMTIRQPGPLSLIQDYGRRGVQHLGISQCGALDPYAMAWANRLLGNAENAAVVEVSLGLLEASFSADTRIALTGADCSARLNGKPLYNWSSCTVRAGDTLELGGARQGVRAYLAVAGGWQTPVLFGSHATHPRENWPEYPGQLAQGDQLTYTPIQSSQPRELEKMTPWYAQPDYRHSLTVRVYPCYQYGQFSQRSRDIFFGSTYHVSAESDRMGYRLTGPEIHWQGGELLSEPIAYGAVQIPANGQPIVLLNDRQTIGGYPKMGCVRKEDCWLLSQRQPGQEVKFVVEG